jgi:type I restriction enzyme M protein
MQVSWDSCIFDGVIRINGGLAMITGELRNKVDKIWEIFWTGGITNPLSVIEQFTYLLFIKGLDDKQLEEEKLAEFMGTENNWCLSYNI